MRQVAELALHLHSHRKLSSVSLHGRNWTSRRKNTASERKMTATPARIASPYFTTSSGILAEPYNSFESCEGEGDGFEARRTEEPNFCRIADSLARSEIVKFFRAPLAMAVPSFLVNENDGDRDDLLVVVADGNFALYLGVGHGVSS